jgi:hypothetical protein
MLHAITLQKSLNSRWVSQRSGDVAIFPQPHQEERGIVAPPIHHYPYAGLVGWGSELAGSQAPCAQQQPRSYPLFNVTYTYMTHAGNSMEGWTDGISQPFKKIQNFLREAAAADPYTSKMKNRAMSQ